MFPVALPEAEEAPLGGRGELPKNVHQGPALLIWDGAMPGATAPGRVTIEVVDVLAQVGDAGELHQGMHRAPCP